jgi:hypothetical protein
MTLLHNIDEICLKCITVFQYLNYGDVANNRKIMTNPDNNLESLCIHHTTPYDI